MSFYTFIVLTPAGPIRRLSLVSQVGVALFTRLCSFSKYPFRTPVGIIVFNGNTPKFPFIGPGIPFIISLGRGRR